MLVARQVGGGGFSPLVTLGRGAGLCKELLGPVNPSVVTVSGLPVAGQRYRPSFGDSRLGQSQQNR